eukprot:scaffold13502_cov70-Phaeocystis_antarctica.AAC.6
MAHTGPRTPSGWPSLCLSGMPRRRPVRAARAGHHRPRRRTAVGPPRSRSPSGIRRRRRRRRRLG